MTDQGRDGVDPIDDSPQPDGSVTEPQRTAADLAPHHITHPPAQVPHDGDHLPAEISHDAVQLPARVPQDHETATARSPMPIDVWSVGQLVIGLLLVPISVLSASLLAMPFGPVRWTVVAVFYASGICLFLRPVAKAFAYAVLKCRTPTQYEARRLERVWPAVVARADVREKRFHIMIYTGSGVNAIATFGDVIAVTRGAMALPDAELEGILAHELGHHLRFHTFVTPVIMWLTLPVVAVSYIIGFIRRTLYMLRWMFWLSGFGLLLILILWFLGLVVTLLFASIAAQSVLLILFGRFAEYSADNTAVRLGFASGLLSALQMMAAMEPVGEPPTLMDRLWASHPPLYKRIRRLENRVAI